MPGSGSVPVFYTSNGQGGLVPSSAGAAMVMALAEDIKNSPAHVDVPDHKMMAGRQARVDRYFAKNGGVSEYEAKSFTVTLPKVASPQRLFTTYQKGHGEPVAKKRAAQFKQLEDSFVGDFHEKFHTVLDKAIQESSEIESRIRSHKGGAKGMFSSAIASVSKGIALTETEKSEIFAPIENTINGTNKYLKSQDFPCRIVWRRVVEPNSQWSVDSWLVFANSPEQASEGISSWLGSTDIVDPRDRSNKSASRLDMYHP